MMESQNRKRAPAWTEREVQDLIAVWGEESVLSELRSSFRNAKTFVKISQGIKSRGHNRALKQCHVKLKELRQAYQKTREANGRSGSEPQTCRFYDELHAILGGSATTTPAVLFDSFNGDGGNTEAGALPAPTLYLSQMSARVGDSVQLQCSVFSWVPATRIIFCKNGKEFLSQTASEEKVTYDYDHKVSRSSTGNYACGYKIKDSNNRMNRSQLSPAQRLSVTGPAMSPAVWAARCVLVLLLLVSAPIITFVLEKRALPEPAGLEETHEGSSSVMEGRGAESGRTPFSNCFA
ncbi:Zinc finger and SCAN domain-containing protein 29 [Chelonia mydas]|uniref:Zinc finger and SCAN domain-containing protein 29 n=1 Tax=Chelonia mydas TaxID=8469 RepID=M7BDV8_CHEMY|nr:Zinc finger and SCAN domain-containing protein 29 [Chelonia mydas]